MTFTVGGPEPNLTRPYLVCSSRWEKLKTMSADENKASVRRLLERVRAGWDRDVIEDFFAPSYRKISQPHDGTADS